ncbi:MAG: hypothetical protein IPM46_04710 [Flavobacteriales bacterium]|nr:hypothetical protein [Flavobacteriales bacterium]
MKRSILSLTVCFNLVCVAQLSQRIEYHWLNQVCADLINCDGGCTACNIPTNSAGSFFGTNAAFIGVSICPLPINVGDNAVFTGGWDLQSGPGKTVIISGIATVPMRIDSIRFRHSIYSIGPDRVKVAYTANAAMAPEEVADVEVPTDFTTVSLADLGCVQPAPGAPMGTFQIRFTPYGSTEGGWALDEVIIVGSTCEASTVGVAELAVYRDATGGPWVDLLGRPMTAQPAPGVYIAAGKRVRVVE